MTDMMTAFILVNWLSPVLTLGVVAGVFAAVRRSERVKPLKAPRNG